jgi:nitroreductase
MNEILNTLKKRRSVRQYRPQQIEDKELEKILEAAIYAPTGRNEQPWHFTVVQDPVLIKEISDGAKKVMTESGMEWLVQLGSVEDFNIFHRAPTAVIVAGKKEATTPLIDCSAAVQNMLLAAESLDIGSCWIGFAKFYFLNPENMRKFNIPADHEVYFGVSLGYKVRKNPPAPERNKEVFSYFK